MTPSERLSKLGFHELRPQVHIRLYKTGERIRGLAIWQQGGLTMYAGAQFPIKRARKILLALCKQAASQSAERRRRARKKLEAALQDPTAPVAVAGTGLWEDVEEIIEGLGEVEVGRFGDRLKRVARRMRERVHRISRRIADNKVMNKIRRGVAHVLDGPVGNTVATLGSTVVSAFGVPQPAANAAIRAHFARKSDRLRKGGWAGVVHRSTVDGNVIRNLARDEGRRHQHGLRKGIKGAVNLGSLLGGAQVGEIDYVLDEIGDADEYDELEAHPIFDTRHCV